MDYFVRVGIILGIIFFSVVPVHAEKKPKQPKRPIIGWSEKISLSEGEVALHARMDTSRASSTIHVTNIKKTTKGKKSVMRFTVKDRYGAEETLERKLLRQSKILTASGNKLSRYVVELGFCLGGEYFEDELELSERSNADYDVRLGRQSLEGHFVVDPALSYTTKPDCKQEIKQN